MSRLSAAAAALLLLAGAAQAAAFDAAAFRWAKPVQAEPRPDREELAAVRLDAEVYHATRGDLADLRLVDDLGAGIPYVLEKRSEPFVRRERRPVPSRLLSLREAPTNRLDLAFALEPDAPPAAGLTFHTPLSDYEHAVRVEGSADGSDWTTLVAEAVIFDYSRFMDIRQVNVAVPSNACRQFRVAIADVTQERAAATSSLTRQVGGADGGAETRSVVVERRPFRIDRVEFWQEPPVEAGRRDLVAPWPVLGFEFRRDPQAGTTIVDVRTRREPITEFTVLTGSRNFVRPLDVQVPVAAPDGGTDWVTIGAGTLTRVSLGAASSADLTVPFPEQREARYRLVIREGDNPPLAIEGIRAQGPVYRALFVADPARTYRLCYGCPEARAPRYDLAQVLGAQRERGPAPVEWALGPAEASGGGPTGGGPAPRLSWLRGRRLLFMALAAMVATLAWGIWLAVRRVERLPKE